jgi:hypothetical protein
VSVFEFMSRLNRSQTLAISNRTQLKKAILVSEDEVASSMAMMKNIKK